MEKNQIERNAEIEVEFIDLSYEGMGVAKVDGFPIFVENALPGEKGKIRITRVGSRFAYGTLVSLSEEYLYRLPVKEKDRVLNHTIPLQHIDYDRQLVFKSKLVKDLLAKEASLSGIEVKDTIGVENPWHYRNKTMVPVRSNKKRMETGVFENRSHRLIPVDNFKINLLGMDEIVSGVRDILMEFNEKPYDEKTHTGNIRSIIVRMGYHTGEVMVIIVTRSKSLFPQSKIIPAITEKFPNVVSIVHNINREKTAEHLGSESKTIFGKDTYQETILEKTYDISAHSFLQVNTPQAERLYSTLIDCLELKGTETVLDAYCGLGTISLSIANQAKQVIGIELIEEAVSLAHSNAELNQINNVEFLSGSVEDIISTIDTKLDVVIVDPPRKGLEPDFISEIVNRNPEKIAYISCNPATLVRDLKLFVESGYSVNLIQPVDMFPQTVHVETCVLLSHKNSHTSAPSL